MQYSKLAALLLLVLPLSACTQSTGGDRSAPAPLVEQIDPQKDPIGAVQAQRQQQSADLTDVSRLRAEILRLTRDKTADNVQQCLVLPLGHKPCGGPAEYIAVSIKGKDEGSLLQKISGYNQAVEADNVRRGLMSDCAVVEKPAVQLVNGKCELVAAITQ
jgi:predicted Mrr-cat superfamily restriction endonuclease